MINVDNIYSLKIKLGEATTTTAPSVVCSYSIARQKTSRDTVSGVESPEIAAVNTDGTTEVTVLSRTTTGALDNRYKINSIHIANRDTVTHTVYLFAEDAGGTEYYSLTGVQIPTLQTLWIASDGSIGITAALLPAGDYGDISISSGGVWTIDNDVVTFAKMQNIATDRLLGRDTAGSGDVEEISVGGGIEFTGSGGIQRSALTGDIIASAGSNATSLGAPISFGGRLTLTSATPVTTSDVTGATTIYYTPYLHNRVPIYASSAWTLRTFTERSLALGTLTSGRPYDVFIYDSSGTLALELLAWTSDTARATALTTQDGVYVKSGDATRVYLGTFRSTSTTATEDSLQSRYVWNMYNRVPRPLRRHETTASWNYNSSTFQQSNASASNQVNVVVGLAETMLDLTLTAGAAHSSGGSAMVSCLAEDWVSGSPTTGYSETAFIYHNIPNANNVVSGHARLTKYPAIGKHSYVWIERNTSGATGTFYGNSADVLRCGITGSVAQ